ncbi:MAG: FecR family protein [Candidatus Sericytochromatia bacterium]
MFKKVSIALGIIFLSSGSLSAISQTDLRLATITELKNNVELKYSSSDWRPGRLNQLLRPGTSIRTGSLSKVEIKYPDGTITRIGGRTSMTVLDKSIRAVKVDSGKIWFKVTKRSAGYRIYSPTAVAAITGTEGFVEYGDVEKTSSKNNMFASNSQNYKISDSNSNQFSGGLVEGSMDVYPSYDQNGDLTGNPQQVLEGQFLTFNGGQFQVLNLGTDQILNQNRDVNSSDDVANNNNNNNSNNNGPDNVANQKLDRTNPSTEQVPSTINNNQGITNSPTTGDLEIIIK